MASLFVCGQLLVLGHQFVRCPRGSFSSEVPAARVTALLSVTGGGRCSAAVPPDDRRYANDDTGDWSRIGILFQPDPVCRLARRHRDKGQAVASPNYRLGACSQSLSQSAYGGLLRYLLVPS